ncbi:MAG: flagellar basal body P-ring formation chaperone FlgA [Tepidisphaeraceae bacterium]|jgi:flagella basal body P-ring formation protein FlgA
MNNRRPLSKRKTARLLVALTILAWATQTLVHQWGFGQETEPSTAAPNVVGTAEAIGGEKFVSGGPVAATATLELRGEASVYGPDVKLKQLCRWSDADGAAFAPLADLVIVRMSQSTPFRTVSVDEVRQTLHDAGANLGVIDLVGAQSCTVTRSDAQTDPRAALQQWIDSHKSGSADSPKNSAPQTQPTSAPSAAASETSAGASRIAAAAPDDKPVHSLRELLTADVCQRLGIAADAIQLSFRPEDEKVLALAEPCFKFDVQPDYVRNLGRVSWDVAIFGDASSKRINIAAMARAWQEQVVVARPLAARQVLAASDFTPRRVLVGTLPEQTLLSLDQCVGQQAAGDLKPGTVMTCRMVDPVPLVRAGQLVTVVLSQGSVQIKAVARALEAGAVGQNIKVRNETTRDIFDVVVTGVQEARLGGSAGDAGIASSAN